MFLGFLVAAVLVVVCRLPVMVRRGFVMRCRVMVVLMRRMRCRSGH